MQRKLSEKRNLRQLKEQYNNIRKINTSRPQSTRKVKETNSLKRSINNPLPDATISEYRYKNNSK